MRHIGIALAVVGMIWFVLPGCTEADKACVPGEAKECPCPFVYQECNESGTGYSKCKCNTAGHPCSDDEHCAVDMDYVCDKAQGVCVHLAQCESTFKESGAHVGVCQGPSSTCELGDSGTILPCICLKSEDCGQGYSCLRGAQCYCMCMPIGSAANSNCGDPTCQSTQGL